MTAMASSPRPRRWSSGTRDGDGGALLFQGAAGIGKTALLDAGAILASASDVAVLRAQGGEVERELSFGLVRELFEPLLRSATPSDRARWFSGAAQRLLGRVRRRE